MATLLYLDVHTHLTHSAFNEDKDAVIQRAIDAGLGTIVVNGTEPRSNREILDLAQRYPVIKVALGIYPVEAVASNLPREASSPAFKVDDEIKWIAEQCATGKVTAIGECGLDGHMIPSELDAKQESVFCKLIEVAKTFQLPLIVHSRSKEQRTADVLMEMGVKRVNFHCFTGRSHLAKTLAEKNEGWYFSIPSNAVRSDSFQKLLRILPPERILTETDAPYLAKEKNGRSEPADVVLTVELLAKIRGWSVDQAKEQVWQNYQDLIQ